MFASSSKAAASGAFKPLLMAGRLAGLVAALFVLGFFIFASGIEDEPASPLQRADGLVALTGGEARISEALKLLSRGYAKRMLISGVNPTTTRFQLVRLNPQNAGLFRCCIDLDQNALDTVGNAEETAAWARRRGFRSLIVVTSSYHMPRSLLELRRTLPGIKLIAYPVTPPSLETERWWTDAASLKVLLSEYLKLFSSLARLGAARLLGDNGAPPPKAHAACQQPSSSGSC